jgi:hypothetical protein
MPEANVVPLWREQTIRYVSTGLRYGEVSRPRADSNDSGVGTAIGAFFNGRERYLDKWKALLATADG